MRGNIKVVIEGRGRLTLGEMNYVRTGGEAAVYRAERTIIKCYTDPRKMGRDGMADKVKLLAATLRGAPLRGDRRRGRIRRLPARRGHARR